MNKDIREIVAKVKEFKLAMNNVSGIDNEVIFPYERGASKYWDIREDLVEYMKMLDFETIKELKILMYVGRDYYMAYTIEGFRPEYYRDNITGLEIYSMEKKGLDDLGWGDKSKEINQMVSKAPLGEYLERGLEILIG